MAKVFRIFRKSLRESETHWFNSDPIDRGIIDSIDVQETEGKKLPTSIPSPFAQIDLVRSAFTTVNEEFTQKGVDLNATNDAHRIVSNALDIGQILFNFDKFKENLSIEYWDKTNSLNSLLESSSEKHQHLGNTLRMFLSGADAENFNFDKLEKIFILKYNNQVIGGTSPKTLFFSSVNALDIDVDINCDNDKMLDEKPLALYKRNKDFISFLFKLKENSNFSSLYPEVNEYLEITRDKVLNKKDIDFSNSLRKTIPDSKFEELRIPGDEGIKMEILPGFPLYKSSPVKIDKSDFFIKSTKQQTNPPMVLPVNKFDGKLLYVSDIWDPDTEVPMHDKRPLGERTLPRLNDKYPYLTISDFLEDELIKLPYKINNEKFIAISQNEQYLIPIKIEFFDYFTAQDLIESGMLSMSPIAGDAIDVKLSIPIQKGNTITYSKTYHKAISLLDTDNTNRGVIQEANFTLGIYPFVTSKTEKIDATVAISETSKSKQFENLSLYDSINANHVSTKSRDRATKDGLFSQHHLVGEYYDVVQLKILGVSNIVVPKLKVHDSTSDKYEFAIDFGTTNTHIEYVRSTGKDPEAYKLEHDHFVFLRDESPDPKFRGNVKTESEGCEATLTQELIHNNLGKEQYSFPFRSVIFENNTINYNNPHYLYGDVNIGFDYEKTFILPHLTRRSNLKWLHLDSDNNNKRIEKFIRQLLELCKNKVLLSNGNLRDTKITWLYPTSMSYNQRSRFEEIWNDQFKEVFKEDSTDRISSIPESIAPFYYYLKRKGLMNQTAPTVSIDIGGGTSDITVFSQNKPQIVSSFRFAGNSIFGDGFNNNISSNGFVKRYYPKYKKRLEESPEGIDTTNELRILNEIYSNYQSSDDLSNFLFSFQENYNLKKQDFDLNYSKDLKNDQDFKIVFLLFFSSIIYHVAQIMKSKELETPENILFSGTASKSIDILDANHKKLEKLFRAIVTKVMDADEPKIKVAIDESPKVLTSKGALMVPDEEIDLDQAMYTYLGMTADAEGVITYSGLNDEHKNGVISNIHKFFDLLDQIDSEMSFKNSFGVSDASYNLFKEIREDNLMDYLLTGINERKEDVGKEDSDINETMFFYPLRGLLNKLASKVVD